jgi:hypothetical protein
MRRNLKRHPDFPCVAVEAIAADAVRVSADEVAFLYRVKGTIGGLRMPPPAASTRTDLLWQHSCFEAFVRVGPGAAYYEFNFSPSTQWAAYHFDAYRSGRRDHVMDAPQIAIRSTRGAFELEARVQGLPAGEALRIGLSAVIEDTEGGKSYWALAHPPGKPDFHHEESFTLELPALPD